MGYVLFLEGRWKCLRPWKEFRRLRFIVIILIIITTNIHWVLTCVRDCSNALHVLTHLIHTTLHTQYTQHTTLALTRTVPFATSLRESSQHTGRKGHQDPGKRVICTFYLWTSRCSCQQDTELAWLLVLFPKMGFRGIIREKHQGKGRALWESLGWWGWYVWLGGLGLGREAASLACGRIDSEAEPLISLACHSFGTSSTFPHTYRNSGVFRNKIEAVEKNRCPWPNPKDSDL